MPRDAERVAEVRAWLAKSVDDLAAGARAAADPPLVSDVLFHAQQAAEKAMKALLSWHDLRFRKTHDLTELGHLCILPTRPSMTYATVRNA